MPAFHLYILYAKSFFLQQAVIILNEPSALVIGDDFGRIIIICNS